jgi:hypothetical protein
MPRWAKIYCDLPSFRTDCLHTKKQFLRIIRCDDQFFDIIYHRQRGDIAIPAGKIRHNDVATWMELLGAYYVE